MASLIAQRQRLGPGSTSFDKSPLASEQRRCDEILRGYGERERAPDRGLGEQLNEYRIRLASLIQRHSPSFDGAKLYHFARSDDATINPLLETLYAEAEKSLLKHQPGQLREVTRTDRGREITTFYGDPLTWMAPFMGNTAKFGRFGEPRIPKQKLTTYIPGEG